MCQDLNDQVALSRRNAESEAVRVRTEKHMSAEPCAAFGCLFWISAIRAFHTSALTT